MLRYSQMEKQQNDLDIQIDTLLGTPCRNLMVVLTSPDRVTESQPVKSYLELVSNFHQGAVNETMGCKSPQTKIWLILRTHLACFRTDCVAAFLHFHFSA
jgi:hypothetical protein